MAIRGSDCRPWRGNEVLTATIPWWARVYAPELAGARKRPRIASSFLGGWITHRRPIHSEDCGRPPVVRLKLASRVSNGFPLCRGRHHFFDAINLKLKHGVVVRRFHQQLSVLLVFQDLQPPGIGHFQSAVLGGAPL